MRISVFGLGYVGAVTMGCLARRGHHVFGVDVNEAKLESFRRGVSPIVEQGLSEYIADGHAKGLFEVTTDHEAAAQATDLSIVCVGTPSRGDGGLDLDSVLRAEA